MVKSLTKINKEDVLIIVDGMNLFHRQFHIFGSYSIEATTFGFVNSLFNFNSIINSNKFIVCWENKKGTNWRNDSSKEYKEKRKQRTDFTDEQKEKFRLSLNALQKFLSGIGIIQLSKIGCEADDLVGYLTVKEKRNVRIVSNDKDFTQFVNDDKNIKVLKPIEKGKYIMCGEKEIKELFGVEAKNIPKYLAIAGDTSDGVKGVKNFGKVKAVKLINDGMINKEKIKSVFNKEQLDDFLRSYKLVKLGNDKYHHIEITKDDVVNKDADYFSDVDVYLDKVGELLGEYMIKKFKPLDIKLLFNKEMFQNYVTNL